MRLISLVSMCLISSSVLADWTLNPDSSRLHFVSTKNTHISEVSTFGELSGSLSEKGKLEVEVALASVDTGIEIRDTRMREKLFNVDSFPSATFTAQFDETLMALKPGQQTMQTVTGVLNLNDRSEHTPVDVMISRLTDGSWQAHTVKPLVIQANSFNLVGGIGELQAIAGLTSISFAVPVTFSVVFE